jgi:hypothetical protein
VSANADRRSSSNSSRPSLNRAPARSPPASSDPQLPAELAVRRHV